MPAFDYADSPDPIRPDLADAHRRAWDHVAAPGTWHQLRTDICGSLNARKNERIIAILQSTYPDADALFLQEVGNELVGLLRDTSAQQRDLLSTGSDPGFRDQGAWKCNG